MGGAASANRSASVDTSISGLSVNALQSVTPTVCRIWRVPFTLGRKAHVDDLLNTPNLMFRRNPGVATSGYGRALTGAQGSVRRAAVREESGCVV
ncbi:hypothetical protein Raf01_19330 [Rugosimonospora africana]|uniref:Uncharacterized protein n=1 Tax=Rugosimonospora africana TaxID=556532 RepID=A0A8J3QRC7_9ACTN|nr:hypothetical protein Raf01_19330 [Rugosimonospora africana]